MTLKYAAVNAIVYFALGAVLAGNWIMISVEQSYGQVLETPAYPAEVIPAPPVIDPANYQDKLTLRRLKVCNVDYIYCAGNLLKEQASYAAASKLAEACGGAVASWQLLDLNTLASFAYLPDCQNHKAACGYTLWYSGAAARAMQQQATLQCVAYKK